MTMTTITKIDVGDMTVDERSRYYEARCRRAAERIRQRVCMATFAIPGNGGDLPCEIKGRDHLTHQAGALQWSSAKYPAVEVFLR